MLSGGECIVIKIDVFDFESIKESIEMISSLWS